MTDDEVMALFMKCLYTGNDFRAKKACDLAYRRFEEYERRLALLRHAQGDRQALDEYLTSRHHERERWEHARNGLFVSEWCIKKERTLRSLSRLLEGLRSKSERLVLRITEIAARAAPCPGCGEPAVPFGGCECPDGGLRVRAYVEAQAKARQEELGIVPEYWSNPFEALPSTYSDAEQAVRAQLLPLCVGPTIKAMTRDLLRTWDARLSVAPLPGRVARALASLAKGRTYRTRTTRAHIISREVLG